MPSQLALQIARRNKNTTETVGALRLANNADAELAEVRTVLGYLSKSPGCWCITRWEGTHDALCKRTSALYEKLRIR